MFWIFKIEGEKFVNLFLCVVAGNFFISQASEFYYYPLSIFFGLLGFVVIYGPWCGILLFLGVVSIALALFFAGRHRWLLCGLSLLPAYFLIRSVSLPGFPSMVANEVTIPFLCSVFLFRAVLYLYDTLTGTIQPTFCQSLSYFTLLPNAWFQFFPMVDFSTYCSGRDRSDKNIRDGIHFLVIGTLQLLAFRFIQYYFWIPAYKVNNPVELFQHFVSVYCLYIRVSGQFHIIVGMLHLLGIRLPRTHHLYFFASSVSDYWRRINIYWKYFVQKIFFFPSYLLFSRWGERFARLASITIVFVATGILHAILAWGFSGIFRFTVPDFLFFGVLGIFVVLESLADSKASRAPRKIQTDYFRVIKISMIFLLVSFLWSLWSSPSMADWIDLLNSITQPLPTTLSGWQPLVAFWMIFIGSCFWYVRQGEKAKISGFVSSSGSYSASYSEYGTTNIMVLAAILILGIFTPLFPLSFADRFSSVLKLERQNLSQIRADSGNYYELMIGKDTFYKPKFILGRWTRDKIAGFWNQAVPSITTHEYLNSQTFRGKEAALKKPVDIHRMAILGNSHTFGWGISNTRETYPAILEESLKKVKDFSKTIEVLNFAQPANTLWEHLYDLKERIPIFHPDSVLIAIHPFPEMIATRTLANCRSTPFWLFAKTVIGDLIEKEQLKPDLSELEFNRRTIRNEREVLYQLIHHIALVSKSQRIAPILVLMPDTRRRSYEGKPDLISLATKEGLLVFDLSKTYEGYPLKDLWLSRWDDHPNPQAQYLIAANLLNFITSHQRELKIDGKKQDAT